MANSYMVGNAPGAPNYAAPLVGFQIGDRLADLPKQYFEGQQRARTTALQQPILDPNTGQPSTDQNVITSELLKRGGAEYAKDLLPYIYGQENGKANADAIRKAYGLPDGGDPSAPPQPQGPARGPAPTNAAGPTQVGGGRVTRPALSAIGTDNQGQDTTRSIATEIAGGRDVSGAIPSWAKTIGKGPDDPLSPTEVSQMRTTIGQQLSARQGGGAPLSARNPAATSGGPSDSDGGGVTPTPASGVSGGPGPAAGGGPARPAPAAPFAPAGPQGPGQVTQQPPPTDTSPQAGIARMRMMEGMLRARAAQAAAMPGKIGEAQAAQLTASADSLAKQAQAREDSLLRTQEPTRAAQAQLSAGNPAATVKGQETAATKNAEAYSATYQQIQSNARLAQSDILPRLRTAISLVHDVSTGPMPVELKNQYLDQLGIKHGAAVDDETFNGLVHGALLSEAQAILSKASAGGGGAARGIAPLVDMLHNASASSDKTPAGNARLLEITARAYEAQVSTAKLAQDYAAAHGGGLDPGWDKVLSDHYEKHPPISAAEQADPRLLTAPTAPKTVKSKQDADAWIASQKLGPGDPFKLPDGRIGHVNGAVAPARARGGPSA